MIKDEHSDKELEQEIKKKPGMGQSKTILNPLSPRDSSRRSLRTRRIDSPKQTQVTNKQADGEMKRPVMLRLKSENSANNSVNKSVLPPDQTPTPTGVMNALSSIFPGDDANPSENPFEQDFKKASLKADNEDKETTKLTLPGPEVIHSSDAVVEEEQELEEQEQNEQPSGDNVIEEIQTSFDHEETIENVGNEETIGDEDLNDKNSFREPDTPQQNDTGSQDGTQVVTTNSNQPVMMTANGQNVVFANNSFAQNNNIPIMVMGGNQMVQMTNGANVASPVRIVTEQTSNQAHQQTQQQQQQQQQQQSQQQAQPQQIVIPTSGGGTQMIVNGALNGAVQPFVMQQVMQIQDPNTGQIQTVIAQQPQQQYMIQTVTDPNTNTSSGNNAPPAYTQCVMMPQQVQLLQPQFQVMPNQPMLVNAQGQIIQGAGQQQFQIINHGAASLPQSGQSGQSVQTVPSGATLVQASPSQIPNGQTVTIQLADQKNDTNSNSSKSRSRTASQQSGDGKSSYDGKKGQYASSRPSYTHRPQLSGLSSVVQLSKEALQAIEQAGNDCGGGKRGGPRLNYDDLDPKRRKFLERNRQAAARCRERKKQWIVSLEGRSNELKEDNRRVEEECIRLRSKLDQLRKVLAQQDRNQQVTITTEPFRQKQNNIDHIEAQPMETDSGVESAETLPSGTEIITTKTEMDNES